MRLRLVTEVLITDDDNGESAAEELFDAMTDYASEFDGGEGLLTVNWRIEEQLVEWRTR